MYAKRLTVAMAAAVFLTVGAGAQVQAWSLSGNGGTSPGTNFIGTTDYNDLVFKVNNIVAGLLTVRPSNTSWGLGSLGQTGTSQFNTAVGSSSLAGGNSGGYNTALGALTLQYNDAGAHNTALGMAAMYANVSSSYGTAVGAASLGNNTTGVNNTATGAYSLGANISGGNNTSDGSFALYNNIGSSDNTAVGAMALNQSGITATASFNTACGSNALYNHASGSNNTAVGYGALVNDWYGNNNTAIGYQADVTLPYLTNATAIGANSLVSLSNSIVLGSTGTNVGIGTTSPQARLEVNSNSPGTSGLKLTGLISTAGPGSTQPIGVDASGNVVATGAAIGASGNFLPLTGGNLTGGLLIGNMAALQQQNGAYLLNVAGPVRANQLTVNTTGADFVFDTSYRLMPLAEVEDYVKRNRHLPDMAPAAAMQKDGVEVGESQARLLQKVEELTLYVIGLKKENDRLAGKNQQLEERVGNVEKWQSKKNKKK